MNRNKENCVCWNSRDGECNAIIKKEYDKGYRCSVCAFYKTKRTYLLQTGTTYEKDMVALKIYPKGVLK